MMLCVLLSCTRRRKVAAGRSTGARRARRAAAAAATAHAVMLSTLCSSVWDQVKEKGYAVVVVAEGAGEEILGQTGETDATG